MVGAAKIAFDVLGMWEGTCREVRVHRRGRGGSGSRANKWAAMLRGRDGARGRGDLFSVPVLPRCSVMLVEGGPVARNDSQGPRC